jgi:Flp pilus assembly protein TadD
MTRPTRNRLLIVAVVVGVLGLGPRLPDPLPWVLLALFAPLFVLTLVVVQPLTRARRALAEQRYEHAAADLAEFESALLTSAWKRRLAGLAVGLYSTNALAVARGTLGAVRLEQGRLDDARTHLERALELDPGYAVPHANLAVLLAQRGDAAGAEVERQKAADLGFAPKVLVAVIKDKLGGR